MGPYSIGLIVVCLMDQAEQTVEVFTFCKKDLSSCLRHLSCDGNLKI